MATELNTLTLALRYYKESLLWHLEKADLQIQDAVRNFTESDHGNPSSVKPKIRMVLCDVLQNYVTMLHTFEVLSVKVTENLSQPELEAEPERARPSCNPFFVSPTKANSSDLAPIAIKKECVRSPFTEDITDGSSLDQCRSPFTENITQGTSLDQCSNVPEGTALKEERSEQNLNVQPSSPDQSDSYLPDYSSEASSDTIRNAVEMKTEPEEADQSQYGACSEVSEPTELLANSALMEFNSDDDTDVGDTTSFLNPPKQSSPELNPFTVKPPLLDPSSSHDDWNTCVDDGTTDPINSSELNRSVKSEETVLDKSQRTQEFLASLSNLDVVEPPECEEAKNECRRQVTFDVNIQRVHQFPNENGIKNSKKVFKWKGVGPPNPENLGVGQICNVCHVVSPGEFYVRKDQPLFETMESRFTDDMNRQHLYVVNKFKTKSEAKLHLGSYCCGFVYNRHKWYRVEVLDWMERDSGSNVLVQLIDYGEKAKWGYNQLKPITDAYAQIPKNAIRCHLAGVLSPDPNNRRAWPASSVEFFTKASEIVKKTPFLTIFVSNAGDSYAIDLQKADDEVEGRSLGNLLIMHGHASEVTFSDQTVSEPTSPALPEPELPPRGQYFEVLITGYITACHFYVHILKERKKCGVFNDDFVDLLTAMKAPSLTDTYEPISDVPNIGELLLVEDSPHWYRGRCLRVCKDQRIEIFLEDFGCRIKKHPTSVRKMKDEFLKVPFQAVECVLHNCKEKMEDGDVSSENFFNCVMKMKLFKALLVDAGKPMKLQLWDSKNHDLGVVLKQYGLSY